MRNIIISTITAIVFIQTIAVAKYCYISKHNIEIDNPETKASGKETMKVKSLQLPTEIKFSNECVPLGYFDIRERLEREIAINELWHSSTYMLIKRANRYLPAISKILIDNGLPDDMKYIPVIESGLTNAVSPAKAVGFWQFLEGTAKEYGLEISSEVDERYNWKKSTIAACKYLKWLKGRYNTWTLTAAAYNYGTTALNKQINIQQNSDYYSLLLPEETERYIFRILALKLILTSPSKHGYELEEANLYQQIKTEEIEITQTITNLAEWANDRGYSYRELKYFNPWLRTNKLTVKQGSKYYIELPTPKSRYRYKLHNCNN